MRRHWLLIHRGSRGSRVFSAAKDYRCYERDIWQLAQLRTVRGVEHVAAWCLVPDAAALVVTVSGNPVRDEPLLAQFMTRLAARHTVRLTGVRELPQAFWENTVVAVPVSVDRLAAMCRFVELTSVRACLAQTPAGWRWSSYRCGGGCRPVAPGKSDFFSRLSSRHQVAESWRTFVDAGVGPLSRRVIDAGVRAGQVPYTRKP